MKLDKKNKSVKFTWMCRLCGDVIVSKSNIRHSMDFCRCRKTGVDLEEHYERWLGPDDIEEIERTTF